MWRCFNIRSFGSWIASCARQAAYKSDWRFNIRSFGSWIASPTPPRNTHKRRRFQYPLFRIVDCFRTRSRPIERLLFVSISALSDRGLLRTQVLSQVQSRFSFNIRSFGSWIASGENWLRLEGTMQFQYPLFRIVDCFAAEKAANRQKILFQYPLFRIVDCFTIKKSMPDTVVAGFNIRSFGSWIASILEPETRLTITGVSISALSDRGLLRITEKIAR